MGVRAKTQRPAKTIKADDDAKQQIFVAIKFR
jgi:hypothetical protein